MLTVLTSRLATPGTTRPCQTGRASRRRSRVRVRSLRVWARCLCWQGRTLRGAQLLVVLTCVLVQHVLNAVLTHNTRNTSRVRANVRVAGKPAALRAEVARLEARLAEVEGFDGAEAAIAPDAERDADGAILAAILRWREQRKAAIASEIARLRRLLADANAARKARKAKRECGAGGGGGGDGGSCAAAAEE